MATRVESIFTLAGTCVDPKVITERLGISPTRTWRSGDPVGTSLIRMKFDGWAISTGRTESLDLAAQVRSLLDRLAPVRAQIAEAQRELRVTAEVSCVIHVEDHTPSMNFDRETLSTIVGLGASLDFDLYVFIDEAQHHDEPTG